MQLEVSFSKELTDFSCYRKDNFISQRIVAPRKAGKKQDASADDSNPNTDVLSDTTPRITDTIKSWKQVYDILEHEIINCPDDSDEEDDQSFTDNLRYVVQSELHKIIA